MLINNSIESMYNGVSQQASEHRQPTQVKEMINAYPTIDKGLLKRNPTTKLELSGDITYSDNSWTYEYDRGTFADEEKYAIKIDTDTSGNPNMEIVNVVSGKVYKSGSDLILDGESSKYLSPFGGRNGYSALTIKDTTFIVNKNVVPALKYGENSTGTATENLDFSITTLNFKSPDGAAPSNIYFYYFANLIERNGSTTTITVDGNNIVVDVPYYSSTYNGTPNFMTLSEYVMKVYSALSGVLKYKDGYIISTDGSSINISKEGVSYPVVSSSITMKPKNAIMYSSSSIVRTQADYLDANTQSAEVRTVTTSDSRYYKDGFVWIKSSNPTAGYTYNVTVSTSLGYSATFTSTGKTTTELAASDLATLISADSIFTATASGSVIKITVDAGDISSVETSDSYGNQASIGWAKDIQYDTDLPKTLGFEGAIVKVVGSNENSNIAYWLVYKDGLWRETLSPEAYSTLDGSTMPHILVKNADDTFTLKQYAEWEERKVGDDNTNKSPLFIDNPIKDIFFFKNRLGLITNKDVCLSEVGEYGNFFRTTIVALLDSDPINTTVDSTKVTNLEYATYLQDSIMLFGDKSQFKLDGGKILSPSSVQISQTSSYEVNTSVRPIMMNNRIFFCSFRGTNTAVMEYMVNNSTETGEAVDITAHVQSYIPSYVVSLSGSSANNMLFLNTATIEDTIFVYKYFDSGDTRHQSAWFKWSFNGKVYSSFSLGRNLNLMIHRNLAIANNDWVLGSGIWNDDKYWNDEFVWVDDTDSLGGVNQFETMQIAPMDYEKTTYLDVNYYGDNTYIITGLQSDGALTINDYLARSNLDVYLYRYTGTYGYVDIDISSGYVDFVIERTDGYTEEVRINAPFNGIAYTPAMYDDIIPFSGIPRRYKIIEAKIIPSGGAVVNSVNINVSYFANLVLSENTVEGYSTNGIDIPSGENSSYGGNWLKKFPTTVYGATIPVDVNFGEWVYGSSNKKDIRPIVKFKTVKISSEQDSDFSLYVIDNHRKTIRQIASKYTVDRNPTVYGDTRNIEVGIKSTSEKGFRINTVSYEGQITSRSRRQ